MIFWPGDEEDSGWEYKNHGGTEAAATAPIHKSPVSKELEEHWPDLGCDCSCRRRVSAWQEER